MQVVVDYLASIGFPGNAFALVTHCPRRTLSPDYEPPSNSNYNPSGSSVLSASIEAASASRSPGSGPGAGLTVTLADAGLWPSLTLFLERSE